MIDVVPSVELDQVGDRFLTAFGVHAVMRQAWAIHTTKQRQQARARRREQPQRLGWIDLRVLERLGLGILIAVRFQASPIIPFRARDGYNQVT